MGGDLITYIPGSSGLSAADHFVTSQAESDLINEVNLGALTSGLLKHTVAAGVSVPAVAVAGVDYAAAVHTHVESDVTGLVADLALKAPLASPTFTGTVVVPAGTITLAEMANVNSSTVFYRKTAGAGAPEVQTLATLKTDLGLTGTNSGDQTITLTGDVGGSGSGSFAATIANDVVTYAKIQNVSATDRLLGRSTAGAGDVEEITCTAAGRALIDDADATAQRATLGLGTLATLSTVTEANQTLADNTTANVTSSAHGYAPKSPADATKFLNGAATPAFAAVKDSDLSTSDVTTNNVSTAKHGFVPKAPNDAAQFLDGTGAWSALPAFAPNITASALSIPAGYSLYSPGSFEIRSADSLSVSSTSVLEIG